MDFLKVRKELKILYSIFSSNEEKVNQDDYSTDIWELKYAARRIHVEGEARKNGRIQEAP